MVHRLGFKLKMGFAVRLPLTRANVEHVFRVVKREIGFTHFEGRSYMGLMRHLILCQLVMTFVAEQTDRLRGKNPEITLEQDARALNTVCGRRLRRGCSLLPVELTAAIIQYHQARNLAAKTSRLKHGYDNK